MSNGNLQPKKSRMEGIIKFRGVVIVIGAIIVAWYYETGVLEIKPEVDITSLPEMLGLLLMVSLFVERAIEFALSIGRSAGADRLDRQIGRLKRELGEIARNDDPETIKIRNNMLQSIEDAEDTRSDYRADSRLAALWTGMVIGVIVSLIGVRILGSIYLLPTPADGIHARLFIVVDVLLTGFVLAGGSEAIHKIMSLYDSFMNRATESNKQKTPENN